MRGKRKRIMKRFIALVTAVSLAAGSNLTGISLRPVFAQAEETAITVTGTLGETTADVYPIFEDEKIIKAGTWSNGSPAVDLTQYKVSLKNNTGKTISDWEITIKCRSAIQNYNDGWNGVSCSGDTLKITTYKGKDSSGDEWDNKTIAAGDSASGAGFQAAADNFTGASFTVTYYEGSSTREAGEDATQNDPSLIGKTSSDVKAVFTRSNVDGSYHEYYLKVNNGSSSSVSDWLVRIPVSEISSSQAWGDWAKVKVSYDTEYLYLTPAYSSDNVITAGGTFGSETDGAYKFNYTGTSDIDSSEAEVFYVEGTSSTGVFDNVVDNASQAGEGTGGNTGGDTGGSEGKVTDTTTDLNLDVKYDYAKLLQDTLYFYDANMCGDDVTENSAFSWRNDCHAVDKSATYTSGSFSKTVDVSGGYHDAGDHVKFGLPQGYSATVLALAYYEFPEAFNELGQTAHYKLIMDRFCDYFKKCTVYDGNTVKAFCYQVGEGNSDHSYWGAPEKQTTNRPVYFADSSNPATDEVSVAIAALALNYKNFGNKDYLKTAEDLFDFVTNNSKSCTTEGPGSLYKSTGWEDDYTAAAEALYIATGDSSYSEAADTYYTSQNINTGWVLSWDNTWPVTSLLKKDLPRMHTFASVGDNVTAQGFKFIHDWGSARYNTAEQFMGLSYDKENGKFDSDNGSFASWSTGQMKYLLGNNNSKRNFIVGYNENSSKYPHHRAASNSSGVNQMSADHYTLLGALVGGPTDTNDTYSDSQDNYKANEVALDYNAGIVGAAAGLYLLHKNDNDAVNTLDSKEDLEKIGGIRKFYTGPDTTETEEPEASEPVTEEPSTAEPVTEKPIKTEAPVETKTPEKTEVPAETETPEKTEVPAETETPEKTEAPAETEEPKKTEVPAETETPEKTETPAETETPEITFSPDAAVKNVIDLIDKIGDPEGVSYPGSNDAILAAEKAYSDLNDNEKTRITNADKLTAARKQYDALKDADDKAVLAAEEVDALIQNIGTVEFSDECEVKISTAESRYDALSTEAKDKVKKINDLLSARQEYEALKEKAEESEKAVKNAEDIINSIPDTIVYTSECKEKIDAADKVYSALSDDEKKNVSSSAVNKLNEAKEIYEKLAEDAEKTEAPESTPEVSTVPVETIPAETPGGTYTTSVPEETAPAGSETPAVPEKTSGAAENTAAPEETAPAGSETPAVPEKTSGAAENTAVPEETAPAGSETPAVPEKTAGAAEIPIPNGTEVPGADADVSESPASQTPTAGPVNTSAASGTVSKEAEENEDDASINDGEGIYGVVKGAGRIRLGASYKLARGRSIKIKAEGMPDVTYKVNSRILSVNKKGIIRGRKTGYARLSVLSEGKTVRVIKIKVMKRPVNRLKLRAKRTMTVNSRNRIRVLMSPGSKYASTAYKYSSSNERVISIYQNGMITAEKKGTSRITVCATDGSGKKASIVIRVR